MAALYTTDGSWCTRSIAGWKEKKRELQVPAILLHLSRINRLPGDPLVFLLTCSWLSAVELFQAPLYGAAHLGSTPQRRRRLFVSCY